MSSENRTEIKLENLKKVYSGDGGDQSPTVAVNGISLEVREEEFFGFLGPSGCGKTTTLRMIAGLEEPTEGKIFIGDEDVSDIPANKRNIGLVFQNYALFPHMDVFDNVAFGLKSQRRKEGYSTSDIEEKVKKALDIVDLKGFQDREPKQLSGGEQQRVALARCLANEPNVILFDEPLSNLDAKLRVDTRKRLIQLHRELNITSIYVTHDQDEAMSLCDRIAVLNDGEIQQVGTPYNLYENPKKQFVAKFMGRTNMIPGEVSSYNGAEGNVKVNIAGEEFLSRLSEDGSELREGESVLSTIKAEKIQVGGGGEDLQEASNVLEGEIETVQYTGDDLILEVIPDFWLDTSRDESLTATVEPTAALLSLAAGDSVFLTLQPEDLVVLPE